jgi:hypothetical protein
MIGQSVAAVPSGPSWTPPPTKRIKKTVPIIVVCYFSWFEQGETDVNNYWGKCRAPYQHGAWSIQSLFAPRHWHHSRTLSFLSCEIWCPSRPYTHSAAELSTYLVTYGAEPFLRSCQICSYSTICQHFIEPEVSLPCSQVPSIGPYPEPDQSNPYNPILSIRLFKLEPKAYAGRERADCYDCFESRYKSY